MDIAMNRIRALAYAVTLIAAGTGAAAALGFMVRVFIWAAGS